MNFAQSPDSVTARQVLTNLLSPPQPCASRRMTTPFVLYGAGKLGKMAIDFFDHVGLEPEFVVDASAGSLRDTAIWNRFSLLSPEQVSESSKQAMPLVVSIATVNFSELAEHLAAQGWRDIVPLYDVTEAYTDIYPLRNGWFLDGDGVALETSIHTVLDRWSDNASRAHHLQFMAWHRLRQDWTFADAPIDQGNRYFIPEVLPTLGEQEVFLDIGAHQGEITEAFRHAMKGKFKEILIFEPDPDNAAVIRAEVEALPSSLRDKHRLLQMALSSSEGTERFVKGLGYASQLSEQGSEFVDVRTLDGLNIAPTFVKMHLEGHELDALQGSRKTLIQYRPIVAATVYHNDLGVWELPSWLMETLSDYHFFLRMHSWCGTGAVMYCLPLERLRIRCD